MPKKRKADKTDWETKLDTTHEILANSIYELILDSFCDGTITRKEISLAKE
jgi:hypothetical protein